MEAIINISYVIVVFLVFIRLSALLLMSPLFSVIRLPVHFRVFLLLFLSMIMVTALGLSLPSGPLTTGALIYYGIAELVSGAALAFGVFCAFAAFSFGGRVLDFQMGFGVASLIDPATNAQSPLMGTFLSVLAVMVFFLVDGHHMLLRGFVYSLQQVPPGTMPSLDMNLIVKQFGMMFVFGMMAVAPVILTILLIDVVMGVAARTMPQVNMFIVMLPLKIFVGLVVLLMSLNYILPLMKKVFLSLFNYWQQLYIVS